jgi:hypothetical protein
MCLSQDVKNAHGNASKFKEGHACELQAGCFLEITHVPLSR